LSNTESLVYKTAAKVLIFKRKKKMTQPHKLVVKDGTQAFQTKNDANNKLHPGLQKQ